MGMLWIASDLTDAEIADLRDRLRGTNRSLSGILKTMFGVSPGTCEVDSRLRARLAVAESGGIEQCEDCDYWEDGEDVFDGVCEDCIDADVDEDDDDDDDDDVDEDDDDDDDDDDADDDDDNENEDEYLGDDNDDLDEEDADEDTVDYA